MVIKATLLDEHRGGPDDALPGTGADRPPHLRPWRDGWRHLRFLLLFSPRWLFLYPGADADVCRHGGRPPLLLPGPLDWVVDCAGRAHAPVFFSRRHHDSKAWRSDSAHACTP